MPTDWADYLRCNENKQELFKFLAEKFLTLSAQEVLTNVGETFQCNPGCRTNLVGSSCSGMEEADGRIIYHVKDMVENGHISVLIRSTDTDVVILALSFFFQLKALGLQELWCLYGIGKSARYLSIHDIAEVLGERRAAALRGLHAFSGCDTVSYFSGKGKNTFYKAWNTASDDVTEAFQALGSTDVVSKKTMQALEHFTVKMYNGKCNHSSVDRLRKELFVGENKPLYLIPPTADALRQHVMRSAYQAGQVWGRSLSGEFPPDPSSWGWSKDQNEWKPKWSTLPNIWESCRALDLCKCKAPCQTMRCSCRSAQLPCTPGCKNCKGECTNKRYI